MRLVSFCWSTTLTSDNPDLSVSLVNYLFQVYILFNLSNMGGLAIQINSNLNFINTNPRSWFHSGRRYIPSTARRHSTLFSGKSSAPSFSGKSLAPIFGTTFSGKSYVLSTASERSTTSTERFIFWLHAELSVSSSSRKSYVLSTASEHYTASTASTECFIFLLYKPKRSVILK